MAGARRLRQIRLRDCYQRLLTGARRWPDLFFVSITHESDAAKLEKFLPAYLRSNRHEMSDGERIKADYEMRREWRHIVSEVGLSDPDSEDGPFRSGTEQKPPWIGRYLDMRLFGESIEREWPEQEDDDDDSPRENFVNEEMARRITAFEGIAEICCLELKGKGYSLPANRTARTNIWLDAMMRFAPTLSTDGVKIRLGSVFWESLRFVEWVTDASHQDGKTDPTMRRVSVADVTSAPLNKSAQKALDYIKSHDGCKGLSVANHIGLKRVEGFYSRYVPLLKEHGVYNAGEGYYWKPPGDSPPNAT